MTRFRHKKGAPKPLLWYGGDPRPPGSWERRIAPAIHSWYAYRCHEDASSWEGGLAMVALTSVIASPFFLPVLFSSREPSLASLESGNKKAQSHHADPNMVRLRLQQTAVQYIQ